LKKVSYIVYTYQQRTAQIEMCRIVSRHVSSVESSWNVQDC